MSSTSWKEDLAPGEAEKFERLAATLRELQRTNSGGKDRGLHAKGQAGLEAELTTLPDLPEALRVGIFAAPKAYRAYVRFSNGSGSRQHDKVSDVRGIGVKVVGVPGTKLIPGMEDAQTQDFLLIRAPATPFKDAAEFVGFVKAASASRALLLPRLVGLIGVRRTLKLLRALPKGLGAPVPSLASGRYFSALPLRWGDAAAKLVLAPLQPPVEGKTPADLGGELAARLAQGPLAWELGVQLYVDDVKTPIEDARVEWLASDAPPVPVAKLVLPRQDVASPRGHALAAFVEALSFDPWHAPVEFRPLGDMMRARSAAYRESTKARHAAPEPNGSETFA